MNDAVQMSAPNVLVIVGIVCELAAVGLAWRDLHDRTRMLREFLAAPQDITPDSRGAQARIYAAAVTITQTPPTLEARVDALDERVTQLTQDLQASDQATLQQSREHAQNVAAQVSAAFEAQMRPVRQTLASSLQPSWHAKAAIALLVLGVVLQGAGSLTQNSY